MNHANGLKLKSPERATNVELVWLDSPYPTVESERLARLM